ncbi:esterase-like activity of phytase family protein [Streptomyces kunmingensis]|uniref:Esterase-like activity of phytase family protein n=1 Tax=Streptomyces kunmingensis TaxID=68225 RepID=A0ABU6CE74_9ACTN|nr:esterase-like activity of phytase family protein [Streptomyces kunmingensis]MEB3963009.1 esterase-like activity of phytase family protein [Streptomyces kunmingensis]
MTSALIMAAAIGVVQTDAGAVGTQPVSSSSERHRCSPSVDIRAFSDELDKTTFDDVYAGNLSALAVDRDGRIATLSDESYLFSLAVREGAHTVGAKPIAVVPLRKQDGTAPDSEGLAVDKDGSYLITSETEPSVARYHRDGEAAAELPVPTSLAVAPVGRATRNQTFEGLTLEPGARTLIASMEGALAGDDPEAVRLQSWYRDMVDRPFRTGAQYGYRVDEGLGVAEIASVGKDRLLVLERGYTPDYGNTIRLYLADLHKAQNTSKVETLTIGGATRLADKTLLADLVNCPDLGATAGQPQENPLLDNIEGLAVTGRTTGGGLRILLVSDDNENATQTTRMYVMDIRLPR